MAGHEAIQAPASLDSAEVPREFVDRIPLRFAREQSLVAVKKLTSEGRTRFVLACGRRDNAWACDRVAYKLDAEVQAVPADAEAILKLLSSSYHAESREITEVASEISADAESGGEIQLSEDVLELDDKAPAVKLINAMLLQAVRQRASDIHVEPLENGVRVRFRIDGVLYDRANLRAEVREAIASRVKVMGRMDIAERRLPQDGGVTVRIGERPVDVRISTLPNQHGERVVMRLLDKQTGLMSLQGLGLSAAGLRQTQRLLELSHGIILVTGPTGCGKTTSLYAMLTAMNSAELNILTLEDPIEYQLPGISQTQVAEKKGLLFARGLRSLLRQDPDVIMVGEIRDLETASVSIQAALTGHLVLSTLHTNDAPSSITRLLDLGVEPYLVGSSVNAAIAQRLVRRACRCRTLRALDDHEAELEGWEQEELACLRSMGGTQVPYAAGCEECFHTGYRGRVGIYELLTITEPVRELVGRRATGGAIRRTAIEQGLVTLRRDGLRHVAAGISTLDEVRNATQMDLG
jgi:general secretion pathway protein E